MEFLETLLLVEYCSHKLLLWTSVAADNQQGWTLLKIFSLSVYMHPDIVWWRKRVHIKAYFYIIFWKSLPILVGGELIFPQIWYNSRLVRSKQKRTIQQNAWPVAPGLSGVQHS